ncbi:MAG: 30S ribosomal protein S9 [bacterium]|nr:30S ribosomal protein S9 [bacterium]
MTTEPKKPVAKVAKAPRAPRTAAAPAAHKTTSPSLRFTEGIGRRKTAVARVRLTKGTGNISINNKKVNEYFTLPRLAEMAQASLNKLHVAKDFDVTAKVSGGGIHAQAEAVRHGIARALVILNAENRPHLRGFGFLTRDPRMVERKKYGLRKARRAPQWAKR